MASILLVRPPQSMTEMITIIDVVVNMSRRACVDVLRMANAKAIAPRRPENSNKCCIFMSILFFFDREIFIKNDKG